MDRFSWGECEHWIVSVFAGPEAEILEYGDAPIESDLRAIARMTDALDMPPFSNTMLEHYRAAAQSFVRREQSDG
jgi:hypothetical protein